MSVEHTPQLVGEWSTNAEKSMIRRDHCLWPDRATKESISSFVKVAVGA